VTHNTDNRTERTTIDKIKLHLSTYKTFIVTDVQYIL